MMKLLLAIFVVSIAAIGCKKDNFDKLDGSDQEAFEGMEDAYKSALIYQDSLVYCDGNGCSESYVHHCDSMYHHFVDQWHHHHDNYDHNNGRCDHYHENGNMHEQGPHHHHNNDEGHHMEHHNMMDDLADGHQPYHP